MCLLSNMLCSPDPQLDRHIVAALLGPGEPRYRTARVSCASSRESARPLRSGPAAPSSSIKRESLMSRRPLLVVVLAAGQGTRMKSALPKVLHKIAGRSMLGHVLAVAQQLGADSRCRWSSAPTWTRCAPRRWRMRRLRKVFVQEQQRGTADAVLAAREALAAHAGDVLVLYADTPLLPRETLASAACAASMTAPASRCSASRPPIRPATDACSPTASGWLNAIREDKDASAEERRVRLCNSGVMAFRVDDLLGVLSRIGNNNAKGEYYLTDAVEIARASGARAAVVTCERGRCARRQLARAARRRRGDLPEARAPRRDARGRDADRAGDRLALLRHQDRPRCRHRAERLLRPRRHRRGRRRDQGQLPLRARPHRAGTRASARSRGCAPAPCSAPTCTSAISSR